MSFRHHITLIAGLLTCALATLPLNAADLAFTGSLTIIDEGTGLADYSGAQQGAAFSGTFLYSDVAGPPDVLEADEADYEFAGPPHNGVLTDGSATTDSFLVNVNIQNDHPLDVEEAISVSMLIGTFVPPGTEVDVWTIGGLENGAFFDPLTDELKNGVNWEVVLLSLDTSWFSDLGFQPVPPAIEDADLAIFTVEEASAGGSTLFFALGNLESLAALPSDVDEDGLADTADNCTDVANADQLDTNGDGFGNPCDADIDNDCSVNFTDLGQMKAVFFSTDPDADLDGDGAVNFIDLGLMKEAFFTSPGPSGLPNACD